MIVSVINRQATRPATMLRYKHCMILFCALIFTSANTLGEVSKDAGIVRFYKEMGCKPKPAASKDPLSYDCPSFTQSTETACVVRGKSYKLGDLIEAEPGACLAACLCLNKHRAKRAKPLCANIECPEYLGVPVKRHCRRKYSLDKCCSTGLVCDSAAQKDTESAPSETIIPKSVPPVTCNVSGVVYEEHSKYYPNELPCSRCVCTKDYDGSNKAPWCTDIPCSLELRYSKELQDGCAPVYNKVGDFDGHSQCCPGIKPFRCPTKDDKVIQYPATVVTKDIKKDKDQKLDTKSAKDTIQASKGQATTAAPARSKDTKKEIEQKTDLKPTKETTIHGPQCMFGTLKLNVGEGIQPSVQEPLIECVCEIPPVVTCYTRSLSG